MTKLAKEWKDITNMEYNVAKSNDTLTPKHSEIVLAILDGSKCFSPDSCGFVSLYVAEKYNLKYEKYNLRYNLGYIE